MKIVGNIQEGGDEITVVLTTNDAAYIVSLLGTQLNRMRGRARYYRTEAGQHSSNRPEAEAAHADAEVMMVKRILEKFEDR